MTHSDDFTGRLEDYLHEFDGTTPLPDRVRDRVHAELPRTRQVHRPGPSRMFTMLSNASSGARLGLVAAAFVVVAVLGAAVLNSSRSGEIGGQARPTPAQSVAPVLSPSVGPSASQSGAQILGLATGVACDATDTNKSCLPAGTYELTGGLNEWPATITLDLPAGWFEWSGGSGWDAALIQGGAQTNYNGTGWGVMFTTIGNVFRDPCDTSKGTIAAAHVNTPQKLAAVIATWPKFTVTAPRPITVDGHTGVELTVSRATQVGCGSGTTWLSATDAMVDAYPFANGRQYRTSVRIVDTGRGLLVIRSADFADTSPFELQNGVAQSATRHTADQPQLQAILDSVRIAAPASSPSP